MARPGRGRAKVMSPRDLTEALDGDRRGAYYLVHSIGAVGRVGRARPAGRGQLPTTPRATAGIAPHRVPRRSRPRRRRRRSGAVGPPGAAATRSAPSPGRGPGSGRRAARRGDHRFRVGVVRDAPLPGRGPPGDGDAPLGGHRCQPTAVRDILRYLVEVLAEPRTDGRGSSRSERPEVLTYREMMDQYAELAGLRKRRVVRVPFLTPGLSSRLGQRGHADCRARWRGRSSRAS